MRFYGPDSTGVDTFADSDTGLAEDFGNSDASTVAYHFARLMVYRNGLLMAPAHTTVGEFWDSSANGGSGAFVSAGISTHEFTGSGSGDYVVDGSGNIRFHSNVKDFEGIVLKWA